MSKLLVVFGATGKQGGAAISAFLQDKTYRIRGVSRNVDSAGARKWTDQGVEMVKADASDVSSLQGALEGATHIYAVTNWFEEFYTSGGNAASATAVEHTHGINIATAASKVPTLQQYFWSTLPHASALSNGKHPVPYYDSKGVITNYIRDKLPTLYKKTTFLYIAFYATNLFFPPWTPTFHSQLGKYIWLHNAAGDLQQSVMGDLDHNLGPFLRAAAAKPELTLGGKTVLARVDVLPHEKLLEAWGKATEKPTLNIEVGAKDMQNMWAPFGEPYRMMYEYFAWAGPERMWGTEKLITAEDLGLSVGKELIGWEESLKGMDWSSLI